MARTVHLSRFPHPTRRFAPRNQRETIIARPSVARPVSRMLHSASPARVLAVALLLASLGPVSLLPTSASDGHPRSTGVIDVGSGGDPSARIHPTPPPSTIPL